MIWLQILKPPASQAQNNQKSNAHVLSTRGNRSSRLNFVMAAVQVAFIAQQQAAMQDSLFSFIFLIRRLPDTLPSEPVLTVSFPDWHLRLIPPRQFADEMTGNDLSVFLICRRQPFQCQRRDKEIKLEEIKWNTTCFQWRGKTGDLFIFFFSKYWSSS